MKINNMFSFFNSIFSGVPKSPVLGPILLNIFINDLFLWLTKSDLDNFADDNTIVAPCKNLNNLLRTLEKESESA